MAYDPFLDVNPVVSAMEHHRGRVEQVRENSARYAQSYATYTTTGVGEFMLEEGHYFGCTFVDQPVVNYGFSLKADPRGTAFNVKPVTGALPRTGGGVSRWIRDARDFYIGAYVFFTIDPPPVLPAGVVLPDYVIDHDFTFTAIALKDIPAYLLGGV